jgi:hypothetical protein
MFVAVDQDFRDSFRTVGVPRSRLEGELQTCGQGEDKRFLDPAAVRATEPLEARK